MSRCFVWVCGPFPAMCVRKPGFGDVWLTAVLEALSRQRRPDSGCLAYALALARRQTFLDPWVVELACRLAAVLPHHAQQSWFDLADKVAPAKVGAFYEVLCAAPLRSSKGDATGLPSGMSFLFLIGSAELPQSSRVFWGAVPKQRESCACCSGSLGSGHCLRIARGLGGGGLAGERKCRAGCLRGCARMLGSLKVPFWGVYEFRGPRI